MIMSMMRRKTGNLGQMPSGESAAPMVVNDPAMARMQAQINALALKMKAADGAVPPGALVQYYADLSSGELPPENMRIEDLRFTVKINPDGSIASSTDAIQVISRYNFGFRRVMGYAMNPALMGAAPALVTFNVQEQGRNFPIFKSPLNMQAIVANGGSGNLAEWDGVYICVPGTQLAVTWNIDSRWSSLVGTTQEFGIQLLGDNVVCRQ
jgi:hypothetical protein